MPLVDYVQRSSRVDGSPELGPTCKGQVIGMRERIAIAVMVMVVEWPWAVDPRVMAVLAGVAAFWLHRESDAPRRL